MRGRRRLLRRLATGSGPSLRPSHQNAYAVGTTGSIAKKRGEIAKQVIIGRTTVILAFGITLEVTRISTTLTALARRPRAVSVEMGEGGVFVRKARAGVIARGIKAGGATLFHFSEMAIVRYGLLRRGGRRSS